eukprot:3721265-Pyramimonas_sp.AAC.1
MLNRRAYGCSPSSAASCAAASRSRTFAGMKRPQRQPRWLSPTSASIAGSMSNAMALASRRFEVPASIGGRVSAAQ